MDLFHFNDDFIASVACGASDEDTLEMFAEAIRAGADVLEERLTKTVGGRVAGQVQFVDGAFEIPLTQAQFDAEYGGDGGVPQARMRQAIISSTLRASQEMTKALGAD